MKNNYGISEKSHTLLIEAISSYIAIEKVVLFGSRAMGNHKRGSDIDIAIFGSNANNQTVTDLYAKLNEQLAIPYYVDVVNYNTISSDELRKHIDEEGKLLFERKG